MVVRLATQTGRRPNWAKVVNSAVTNVANGIVVDTDGDSVIASVADRPGGIVVDAVATDANLRPRFYRVAVSGDVVHDDALTSQTEGALIWSDGDGTYSSVQPSSGATNTQRWLLGYILSSDALGTYIAVDIQANTDSVT